MKRLSVLLVLLLPQLLAAQSIDIRGFGGLMMNTRSNPPLQPTIQPLSRPNAVGGIGASYRSGRFEYGITASYRRYSSVNRTMHRSADDFDPLTGLSTKPPVETTIVLKDPAIALAPVFNYHFGAGKLSWYAGLSPSYIRYTLAAPTDKNFSFKDGANGWSVEAQIGASYMLIPKLRIFAELNGGYVQIPYMRRRDTYMWAGGMNLGVQLRVWEKASAPEQAASVAE